MRMKSCVLWKSFTVEQFSASTLGIELGTATSEGQSLTYWAHYMLFCNFNSRHLYVRLHVEYFYCFGEKAKMGI